ncbi:macrophage mannose receptor 1-like isoform X6, partial [Clarias magur]
NFTGPSKFIAGTDFLRTWFGARKYCRQYHTDLASSLNSTDDNYLQLLSASHGDSWIGLYRDTWKWADGSNATNVPWAPGKPNNAVGNANCASLKGGLFSDESCTNLHSFFCYTSSPMRGQIIRLQVMSDGSLLDSAVQSSVLAQ